MDRQLAAALRYKPDQDAAPRLVARGAGFLARQIVDLAKKHGVPIREDSDLVKVLVRLDLGREIPPEVYVAVAEIIAFIYRAEGRYGGRPG